MAGGGGAVAASRQQPCEESLVRSNIDKARDSLRREEIKITRDLMVPVVE